MTSRRTVAEAFAQAEDYDCYAHVQRLVAEDLADMISNLPLVDELGKDLRLLELGCGTGFLTEALAKRGIGGDWLVTDISCSMVERCRARMDALSTQKVNYAVLDATEIPMLPGFQFDLICSSLAFQWFSDLPAALTGLTKFLTPKGSLAFSTLTHGTLEEWAVAHSRVGLESRMHHYPNSDALLTALPPHSSLSLDTIAYTEQHHSARDFLLGLKRIGANTARPQTRPLSRSQLRNVMTEFDNAGSQATYVVSHVRMQHSLL